MSLTYDLPDNLESEINDLERWIAKFKDGEISPTELRAHRVPFGVYEQRKKGAYMVRVRCAGACITLKQLEGIAELSKTYGAQWLHITSRQEIQIHYVSLDHLAVVMRELKKIGLASRGGGGNTVRNIMAQEDAGICRDEAFDVTPYAIALTSRLIAEADSWNLPRKFKINFSGSADDRGYATIADVGYIARMKDGRKGFKVYVAGGLGAKSQEANLFLDFVPEEEVYNVAKAVKNIFFKYGNRRNKHAARLRFLWQTLGQEEFRKRLFEEYEAVKGANHPILEITAVENAVVDPGLVVESSQDEADFALWKKRFVRPQKQNGLFSIILPVPLGNIANDSAVSLSRFLRPFGDDVIRMTKDQNLFVRNIPEKYLPNLYNFLKGTFENFNRPYIMDKILSCAGASTCQLGICLSPGAAKAMMKYLERSGLDLDEVADARVNVSGCPNSCGQHGLADVGFFGKVARKGDKVYPAYNVVCGAVIGDGKTKLAEKAAEAAARDVPQVVLGIFRAYLSRKGSFGNFREYIQSETGRDDLKKICAGFKEVPDFEEDKNYYFDWGTDQLFSVAERGKGECSAGMFDLIENDFGCIQQDRKLILEMAGGETGVTAQKEKLLKDIVFYCCRVLLIAKAVEAKSEKEACDYFEEHFINGGLVDSSSHELIDLARRGKTKALLEKEPQIYALAERMKFLYDHMDNAFQFQIPRETAAASAAEPKTASCRTTPMTESSLPPKIVKDFRGVTCPMNFVKTKMELSKLKPRDVLEIWLDDGPPIENVPGSVREEGHTILQQKRINGYWSVLIEKR